MKAKKGDVIDTKPFGQCRVLKASGPLHYCECLRTGQNVKVYAFEIVKIVSKEKE